MSHTPIMLDVAFESGKSILLGDGDRGIAIIPNDGGKREQERLDNAHRIAALWNMAERLGLSTEEIENNAFEKIVISLIDLINHDKAMIESGVFHHFIEVEAAERTVRETLGKNYVEMIRSDSK